MQNILDKLPSEWYNIGVMSHFLTKTCILAFKKLAQMPFAQMRRYLSAGLTQKGLFG